MTQRAAEAIRNAAGSREMHTTYGLVAQSPPMRALLDLVERFALHAHVALIHGEPGTGRSTVAWLMHRLGAHRGGRFREVQCSPAVEPGTVADWFAHEAGSEDSDPGSLGSIVLGEVADLTKAAQASLLSALRAHEMPGTPSGCPAVAVIATSCRDLGAEVEREAFRPDLWYRLNAVELKVPALRDRREDIPALAAHFALERSRRLSQEPQRFTNGALECLRTRPWPGNVRELRNVIERACILSDEHVLGEHAVLAALASPSAGSSVHRDVPSPVVDRAPSDRLDDAQRAHVRAVLAKERGNKARAAQHLGLSRRSLYRLLDRLGA